MKLFFELTDIKLVYSDRYYLHQLVKYYQSQPEDKIYNDILNFDLSVLSPGQLSIFINMARRRFVLGENKLDISALEKHDNGVYTVRDVSLMRVAGEGGKNT